MNDCMMIRLSLYPINLERRFRTFSWEAAFLYCIHTKKLSCLKSGVEFDMNDILYEFKNLHHF